MTGLYEYSTPAGWGDTFFQYVYDVQGRGLVDGTDYLQLGVQVNDGQFLMRYWSGLGTIAEGLRIYDWQGRRLMADWARLGPANQGQRGQMVLTPEVKYPDGGNIRFDLLDTTQSSWGAIGGVDPVYASQLVFTGARRRQGVVGDPVPSEYNYKEVEFEYPYTLNLTTAAAVGGVFNPAQFVQIPVTDYDFELRRCILAVSNADFRLTSPFKITFYNTDRRQTSNAPVLANQFFNMTPIARDAGSSPLASGGQLNFWPCPPMVYRVNSAIRFDIFSLLAAGDLPQTFQLLFKGVRRIPC